MATILFTGCSTGFGATVRNLLQRRGHEVIGIGLNGPDYEVDFTKNWNWKTFLGEIAPNHSEISVLINNVGVTHIAPFTEHTVLTDQDVFEANVLQPMSLTRELIRRNGPKLRIINTISMSVYQGMRYSASYVASKAALDAFTRCLAREYADRGLISVGIAPGLIENTQMSDNILATRKDVFSDPEQFKKAISEKHMIGRMLTHQELFNVYCFCIESMPEYMTGTIIKMPGGAGCQ